MSAVLCVHYSTIPALYIQQSRGEWWSNQLWCGACDLFLHSATRCLQPPTSQPTVGLQWPAQKWGGSINTRTQYWVKSYARLHNSLFTFGFRICFLLMTEITIETAPIILKYYKIKSLITHFLINYYFRSHWAYLKRENTILRLATKSLFAAYRGKEEDIPCQKPVTIRDLLSS